MNGSPNSELNTAGYTVARTEVHRLIPVDSATSIEARLGFWALTDQGLVSLGNFATNILLARNLLPNEFGVFAILFGALIFLFGLHSAVVTYPLSVRGASASPEELRRLTTFSVLLSNVIGVPVGFLLFLVSSFFVSVFTAMWAAIALLCWISQETFRRALMAHMRHREALWGDVFSYWGQIACLLMLNHGGLLRVETTFIAMSATSLLGAILQAQRVGIRLLTFRQFRDMCADFWCLGRWMLMSNFVAVFSVQFFPWILALFKGSGEAGSLQALTNVLGVTNPILISTTNLIVPASTKAWQKEGKRPATRVAARYGMQAGLLVIPYLLITALWPQGVLAILYGSGSIYTGLTMSLRVLVVGHALFCVSAIIASVLNAFEQSKINFMVLLASAFISVTLGMPLMDRLGLLGAAIAIGLGALLRTILLSIAVRKQNLELPHKQPHEGLA